MSDQKTEDVGFDIKLGKGSEFSGNQSHGHKKGFRGVIGDESTARDNITYRDPAKQENTLPLPEVKFQSARKFGFVVAATLAAMVLFYYAKPYL